jgi:hypothetical protein
VKVEVGMPYKDKEKQKKYQRSWAKRKRKIIGAGVVTHEELTRVDIQRIRSLRSWKKCVEEASGLLTTHKKSRMKVVEIAVQACVIQQGGDRRTMLYQTETYHNTLQAFAKEVGIAYKTLYNWFIYKREVYDRLSAEEREEGFNLAAVKTALYLPEEMAISGKDTVERYRNLQKMDSNQRTAIAYLQDLRRAAKFFADYGLPHKFYNKKQLKVGREYLDQLSRFFGGD